MTETIVFRLLENIVPLLLVLIILLVIIYVLIKKLFSPFSAVGNFLWDRSTRLYNKIAQERKTKIDKQLKEIKIENSKWKNKYFDNTKYILEIKEKLNDISKIFTELNEIEIRTVVFGKNLDENNKLMDELNTNTSKNIYRRFITTIRIKKITGKNTSLEKIIAKNDDNIINKKKIIKTRINELLDSVNNLEVNV